MALAITTEQRRDFQLKIEEFTHRCRASRRALDNPRSAFLFVQSRFAPAEQWKKSLWPGRLTYFISDVQSSVLLDELRDSLDVVLGILHRSSVALNRFDEHSCHFLLVHFVIEKFFQLLDITIRGLTLSRGTLTRACRLNRRISAMFASPDPTIRVSIHRHSTPGAVRTFEPEGKARRASSNELDVRLPGDIRQSQGRLNDAVIGIPQGDHFALLGVFLGQMQRQVVRLGATVHEETDGEMRILVEVLEKLLGVISDGVLKVIAGEMPIGVHLSVGRLDQARMTMSNAHRDDPGEEVQIAFARVIEDELAFGASDMQRFFVLKKGKGEMIGKELSDRFLRPRRTPTNDLKNKRKPFDSSEPSSFVTCEEWRCSV